MAWRWPVAWPYPHFMAFAPLDVWMRLLLAPPAPVPPRYWLRLGAALVASALGTALTLPERLVLAPILAAARRRHGGRCLHRPGVMVILGYYRTGTTHLHYLLSCDPRFRTPTWCETLAPQGFVLSWAFLRVFLIPFIAARRPQDDVAIGPDWPAEDDFALCNWALASALPGRSVVPRRHAHYARFHALDDLSPHEYARWRRAQGDFCRKLAWLARGRMLLLKTPSHTARVRHLIDLFGEENVFFVHISRDPQAVIRSNVNLSRHHARYMIQDPPTEDEVRACIVTEYAQTEQRFESDAARIPAGRLARVRYEDLVADPLGQLRRIYAELGLSDGGALAERASAYLAGVGEYRPAHAGQERPGARPVFQPLRRHPGRGVCVALAVASACAFAWMLQALVLGDRHDWLVWPVGVIIGLAALHAARVGSRGLGLVAAAATLGTFLIVAVPATFLAEYYPKGPRYWEWYHVSLSTRRGLLARNNLFWLIMGMVSAYRCASRTHLSPLGRG